MATRLFQLRSRPSIRAAIVGVVLKGQDVEIREVVDSSWVAVTVHTKGFAPKNGFARVDWLAPAKTDASIDVARFTEACFEAANRYAVDPDYLLAVAQLETGVRNIPAAGSPAFGPFQILPDTWSAYVAKGDLGYSPLDRFDPYHQPVVAAMIAAEAAAEFGPALPLDRPPVRSALYAAHLFGVDAARLILDGDPSEPIDTALTKTHRRRAADHLLAANRSLLMEAGQPRPVRMVLDEIGRKLESAMAARQESETIEVRASGLALSELASQRTAATAEVATLKDQTLEKSPDGVPADLVEVSAFAPAAAPADEDVLVQVYLHRLDQDALAEQLSRSADPETSRRDAATLATEVQRGQRIDVMLEAQGMTIDEPAQYVIWRGEPAACRFQLKFPPDAAGRRYSVYVRLKLGEAPVGKVAFKLEAMAAGAKDRPLPAIVGDSARRYEYAFLSYASPDRAEVLKTAQALKAVHIGFFQDLLSLEPGVEYEPKLFQEIDRCDLFLLFWSSHAAASEWVIREAEHALARRTTSGPDQIPDITPIILEGPPVPRAPESLKHLQFNDWLRYVIRAVEAERSM